MSYRVGASSVEREDVSHFRDREMADISTKESPNCCAATKFRTPSLELDWPANY
jgi:hypothetical protein